MCELTSLRGAIVYKGPDKLFKVGLGLYMTDDVDERNKERDRQTEGGRDIQTDRQTDGQCRYMEISYIKILLIFMMSHKSD